MDPRRKAPRWSRKLSFEIDASFRGEVLELSAVGMRLRIRSGVAVNPGPKLYVGTLTFENEAHVRIKVKVARVISDGELALEIAEADKAFYEALPKLRRDTNETPVVKSPR